MELPIQLKFFRKIELYQEYKFENKKASGTNLQDWDIEKKILVWTRLKHHHLASSIDAERINREILNNKHSHEHINAMGSLIQRGYAEIYPEGGDITHPNAIRITKEGLSMGEVIYDVENSNAAKFGYSLFYWVTWLTVGSGVLIVVANAWKIAWPTIRPIFCY